MTFFWRETTHADLRFLAPRLRAADRAEILATRWSDDPCVFADELWTLREQCIKQFVFGCDGETIAYIGAHLMLPTVAAVSFFATDAWPAIARRAHRLTRRALIPAVLGPNVRRAECRVHAENAVAMRWVAALGFALETPQPMALGRKGELFFQYAWTNPDAERTVR